MVEQFWYQDGLMFQCTGCGQCCTGAPGHVWVSEPEVERLARHVGMTLEEFGQRYLRLARGRLSLVEKRNGDCIFWEKAVGCTVYEVRPDQCSSWPFWHGNLVSQDSWAEVAEDCPGCNRGQNWTLVQIQEQLNRSPDRPEWPEPIG